jgi:hypothetical protein
MLFLLFVDFPRRTDVEEPDRSTAGLDQLDAQFTASQIPVVDPRSGQPPPRRLEPGNGVNQLDRVVAEASDIEGARVQSEPARSRSGCSCRRGTSNGRSLSQENARSINTRAETIGSRLLMGCPCGACFGSISDSGGPRLQLARAGSAGCTRGWFRQSGGLALRTKSMLGKQTLCQLSYSRSEHALYSRSSFGCGGCAPGFVHRSPNAHLRITIDYRRRPFFRAHSWGNFRSHLVKQRTEVSCGKTEDT